jgi:hypothetical protein
MTKNNAAETGPASRRPGVMEDIRAFHGRSMLCGEPRNALLALPEELILYIRSLLSDDPGPPPDLPFEPWSAMLRLMNPHWIKPYLYWKISQLPAELRPPGEVVDILRSDFHTYRTRAFRIEHQLADISGKFRDAGIDFIALKGTGLARSEYIEPGLRVGSDIDLLVHPDNVRATREMLERSGYRCICKNFEISKNSYDEEEFVHAENTRKYRTIEIHWDIHCIPRIKNNDIGQVFKRARKIRTGNFDLKVMSPIDAILYSSIHMGYRHNNDIRLIWIKDIDLLCRRLTTEDDWNRLREMSAEYGARLPLELCLKMARLWTGTKMPAEFEDFSTWRPPTENEARAYEYFRGGRSRPLHYLWLRWPISGGIREKYDFLSNTILPKAQKIRKDYAGSKNTALPALYMKRWARIARGRR